LYVLTISVAKRRAVQESQVISVGGSEDLFVGLALEGELMASFAHEDCVPGAPVLFGAHKDQLLSALFTCKDDLLRITIHVYLLRPLGRHVHGYGKPFGCVEGNIT
jgi:hypothetical protein